MSVWTISNFTRSALVGFVAVSITACGGPEARKAEALEAGQAFLEAGNLEKARIEMRNVLQIDPNDSEARYLNGVIAERLENMRQAAGHFRATLDIDPEHVRARAALGRLYVMAGLPNDAIGLVETGLESAPDSASLLAVRGAAYSQLGLDEQALGDARSAVRSDPSHEPAVALLGGVLSNLQDFDEAAGVLNAGIELNPQSRDLRIARALLAERMDDPGAAVAQYDALIYQYPEDPLLRYQAAAFYQRSENIPEAEAALRKAVDLVDESDAIERLVGFIERVRGVESAERELRTRSETSTAAQLLLGDFYRRQDRDEQAVATYEALIRDAASAPEADTAAARLAAIFIEAGERDKGAALVESVLSENPRSADALLVRATLSTAENRPDDAIADFRLLIRDDPEVIAYHLGIAQAYLVKGQATLAEQAMRDAVKAEPNNLKARVDLSQFLARNGKPDAADDLIRSVIVRAPDSVIARDTAVRIAITRGDWAEALERARAIVEIEPDNYVGHHLVGLSLEGLNREPEALESYERALAIRADAADALAAWARVLVRNGDADRVLTHIEAIPETSPSIAAIRNLQGEIFLSQGDVERSREAVEVAIASNPGWWVPYQTLARSIPDEDSGLKAKTLQRGFDAAGAPPQLGIELASLYEKQGNADAAIEVYESMIAGNSFSDVLANNLAMLLATYRTDDASLQRARNITRQFGATNNPAFLNTFGWTRLKSGELDKALPALQQAVNLQPNSALLQYHLGVALQEKGEIEAAQEHLTRALEIGDQFPGADDARARLSST